MCYFYGSSYCSLQTVKEGGTFSLTHFMNGSAMSSAEIYVYSLNHFKRSALTNHFNLRAKKS